MRYVNTVCFLYSRCAYNHLYEADVAGGVFQIRPHKEFSPSTGRDKLLSLSCLSQLPTHISDLPRSSDVESDSLLSNAYDLLRVRNHNTLDPNAQRWNALIRLANFASVESSPICVRSYCYLDETL